MLVPRGIAVHAHVLVQRECDRSVDADELPKVARDLLRAVVGDDARVRVPKRFPRALYDGGDVGGRHGLAQFPMPEITRPAIENRAQIVKRPRVIDVRKIDVPMRVRVSRLRKAGALF